MVKAMMSLHEATPTNKVGSGYSDVIREKVGVHRGSVLSPLLFATVIDVEEVRKGLFHEILYADDLVFERFHRKHSKKISKLESKGLKIKNQNLMVNGSKNELPISKTDHMVFVEKESPQISCCV